MLLAVNEHASQASLHDADINSLADRAAMGLPDRYVRPIGETLPISSVIRCEPDELIRVAQDDQVPLTSRLAAGTVLGLRGDPRALSGAEPEMVTVTGGTFEMGTPYNEVDALYDDSRSFGVRREWVEKESPRHEVCVPTFRLGKYPVTNAEYAEFLADTCSSELPTHWCFGRYSPAEANHPVYTVSADAVEAYLRWLSARTSVAYRLPTEAEWEYAAAGSRGSRFPWGDTWKLDAANTLEAGVLATTPIGIFPAGRSWCGAYDLAGNVEEYVSDRYRPYPGGKLIEDDLFQRLGYYEIARGGAFNRFRDLARNQRRHGAYPRSLYAMGFRLAADC